MIPTRKAEAPESKVKKEEMFSQEIPKARAEELMNQPTVVKSEPTNALSALAAEVTKSTTKATEAEKSEAPKADHEGTGISVERERLWAALLAKRPPTKDGEAVSAWLMEVLSVSDLETPLKENGVGSGNAISALPNMVGGSVAPGAAAQAAAASKEWSGSNGARKSKEGDTPSTQGVLVKKKRPLALLSGEEKEPTKEDSPKNDVGSFAQWKDRKKHKGPKKGFTSPSD